MASYPIRSIRAIDDTDGTVTLQRLKEAVQRFRDERDWEQFHTPDQLAKAISVEAAELLECFLWRSEREISRALEDADFTGKIKDEVADILAYLLSLANAMHIDLASALDEKLKKNAIKYPINKVRGSAKKYTEY